MGVFAVDSTTPIVLHPAESTPSENGFYKELTELSFVFDLDQVYAAYPDEDPMNFGISSLMNANKKIIITETESGKQVGELIHNISYSSDEFKPGSKVMTYTLDSPITLEKGVSYTLSIPEKMFFARTKTKSYTTTYLPATTYTFYGPKEETPEVLVKDLTPTTITPGYLEEVKDLSKFEFAFDQDIYLKDSYNPVFVYDKGGMNAYSGTLSVSADKRTLVYTLDNTITAEGTYYLSLASGIIGDAEWASSGYSKGHTNDDMIGVAVVKGEEQPLKYELIPTSVTPEADAADLTELSSIVMNFSVGNLCYEWGEAQVNLTDEAGSKITTYFSTYSEAGKSGMFLSVKPKNAITTPGTYTLTIPEGQFGDQKWLDSGHTEGATNPEIVYKWTVVKSDFEVANSSIKAGDALASVGIVTLIAETPKAEATDTAVVVIKKNEETVKSVTPKVYNTATSSLIVADFESLQLENDAEYTLELPQGSVLHVLPYSVTFKGIPTVEVHDTTYVEVHDTIYIDVPAEVVFVKYNVSSKVGEAETAISNTNAAVEKGKAFTADINVLDENWTAEVTGATLADNVITTAELTEDANVSVVYTYNGTIVVIDDEATGINGTELGDLKVTAPDGKTVSTGLNEGDTAMLYSMNAALLATGKAAYDKIEFEAPAGVTYLVSIIHNGKKIGVKVMNK